MPVALFERPLVLGAGQPPGDGTRNIDAEEPETPPEGEDEEEGS